MVAWTRDGAVGQSRSGETCSIVLAGLPGFRGVLGKESSGMQALTACTLILLIGLASAARTEPFSGRQADLPANLREPVVPDQLHVRANGCTAAPALRSAAAARDSSSVAVLVQGASRGSCSPADFRCCHDSLVETPL